VLCATTKIQKHGIATATCCPTCKTADDVVVDAPDLPNIRFHDLAALCHLTICHDDHLRMAAMYCLSKALRSCKPRWWCPLMHMQGESCSGHLIVLADTEDCGASGWHGAAGCAALFQYDCGRNAGRRQPFSACASSHLSTIRALASVYICMPEGCRRKGMHAACTGCRRTSQEGGTAKSGQSQAALHDDTR
jgi:hypothetical protein